MRKVARIVTVFVLTFLFSLTVYASGSDVVAKVGDKKITLNDLDRIVNFYSGEQRNVLKANPQYRLKLLRGIVQGMVLSELARKEGIDRLPDVKEQLKLIEERFLATEYLKKKTSEGIDISDKDIEQYYKANKEKFKSKERVTTRHILIKVDKKAGPEEKARARKKAEDLLKRIKNGEDFAKLAKEYSDDPGSKDKGGLVGTFTRGMMVKPFEEAAFSLQPGEISDIVETRFGYHIIKVEKKFPAGVRPLNEVRDQIRQTLTEEMRRERAGAIIDKAMKDAGAAIYPEKLMSSAPASK